MESLTKKWQTKKKLLSASFLKRLAKTPEEAQNGDRMMDDACESSQGNLEKQEQKRRKKYGERFWAPCSCQPMQFVSKPLEYRQIDCEPGRWSKVLVYFRPIRSTERPIQLRGYVNRCNIRWGSGTSVTNRNAAFSVQHELTVTSQNLSCSQISNILKIFRRCTNWILTKLNGIKLSPELFQLIFPQPCSNVSKMEA